MALRSLCRLALTATAVAGGAGGAAIASSDDPATAVKLCTTVPLRLFRVSVTAASIALGKSPFSRLYMISAYLFIYLTYKCCVFIYSQAQLL